MRNATKQEIIADIDRRVADKILEPSNASLLKKLINKAETINEALSIAELGTTYKRTGFHFDKRLEKETDTITYFQKNKDLSFETNKNSLTHKLIIGDNYPALLNLLVEYRNRIDVIYIDPPYGKDSMGEFAQTNYENAITRDNLLSMLYPRLVLARQLLSDNGVIFCSIDDKNQAYVKCLFDEIFGEANFIANIVRNTNSSKNQSLFVSVSHEYCLIYANDIEKLKIKHQENKWNIPKNNVEEYVTKVKQLQQEGLSAEEITEELKVLTKYPRFIDFTNYWYFDKRGLYQKADLGGVTNGNMTPIFNPITKKNDPIPPGGFRFNTEKLKQLIKENRIHFHKDGSLPRIKRYLTENLYQRPKSIMSDDQRPDYSMLKEIDIPFDNPKQLSFMKRIISIFGKESIILDFFAGSGTTGQAVLELNKEDEGKRQFICVQLNENLDEALKNDLANLTVKAQIALCDKHHRPHELSEITAERLRRVMTGKCYDGTNNFKWLEKNKPLGDNLLVLNIQKVANFANKKGETPFDLIDETLYDKPKFKTLREKTEWVCDNFEITQKEVK